MVYPQAGIITSLDVLIGKAKVFLPLFKIETDWIAVASNLLYEENITANNLESTGLERDNHNVYADAEKITLKPDASGLKETGSQETITTQTIKNIMWGTLKVGNEVAVIFLNGDINQGRVIARF
jgi:hypothetical protein